MAFLDEIGNKISKVGQDAATKAKKLVDVSKLNGLIADEEKRINACFLQIGKIYFETHAETPGPLFAQKIAEIQEAKEKILTYSEKVKQLKGIEQCPNCGGEVPFGASFCNSCGHPMPKQATEAENAAYIQCTSCHAAINKNMKFCTSCGKPVEEIFQEVNQSNVQPMQEDVQTIAPGKQETVLKQCSNCGAVMAKDMVFCSECGRRL